MAFTLVFIAVGCGGDDDDDDDDEVLLVDMTPLETTVTVPGDVTGSTTADDWTYFSFKTGTTVPTSQKNTTNWDIRFLGTKMSTNGGTTTAEVGSGANGGAIIMQESDMMKVTQAPTSGYVVDLEATIASMADPKPVVSINPLLTKEDEDDPNYDENQWYAGSSRDLSADGTKCYVIKCGDGNYARIQFTNYAKEGDDRLFTFSYNYTDQPDGRFAQ
jgi:hypothetical protein